MRVSSNFKSLEILTHIYYPMLRILTLACPVLITVIATSLLVRFILQKQKIRKTILTAEQPTQSADLKKNDQLDNLTIVLVAVALCFIICIFPMSVFILLRLYLKPPSCSPFSVVIYIAEILMSLNSSVNFIIYYFKIPAFQKTLKKILCRQGQKEPSSEPQTNVSVVESTHT